MSVSFKFLGIFFNVFFVVILHQYESVFVMFRENWDGDVWRVWEVDWRKIKDNCHVSLNVVGPIGNFQNPMFQNGKLHRTPTIKVAKVGGWGWW